MATRPTMQTTDRPANSRLDPQTLTIEAAENDLRRLAKDCYLRGIGKTEGKRRAVEVIEKRLKSVTIRDLKIAARRSLSAFFLLQFDGWHAIGQKERPTLLSLAVLSNHYTPQEARMTVYKARETLSLASGLPIEEIPTEPTVRADLGVPLQEWHETYWKKRVKPTLDRLEKEIPRDPDDHRTRLERRNSLRNRAEMEVRYNANNKSLDGLRASGVRLVVVNTHRDCSERCRPFQGRVFSLDGTTGRTPDGRSFEPIESATDVTYTTKAGKTYKNGLLGFNCRHYLTPYKDGLRFPMPSEKEAKEEYKITMKQRAMERDIRRYRIEAEDARGLNQKASKAASDKAKIAYDRYRDFSVKNERPVYPARTKL